MDKIIIEYPSDLEIIKKDFRKVFCLSVKNIYKLKSSKKSYRKYLGKRLFYKVAFLYIAFIGTWNIYTLEESAKTLSAFRWIQLVYLLLILAFIVGFIIKWYIENFYAFHIAVKMLYEAKDKQKNMPENMPKKMIGRIIFHNYGFSVWFQSEEPAENTESSYPYTVVSKYWINSKGLMLVYNDEENNQEILLVPCQYFTKSEYRKLKGWLKSV